MRPSSTLLRACGKGSQIACDIAKRLVILHASSTLTFSDVSQKVDNPNKLPFVGTLLITNRSSDKPPHGSESHPIYVSRQAAINALPGIIGMAVNYQPETLSGHASRHKVGVITKAWMEGDKVKVAGFIWKHDFPEAQALRNRGDLGMSMELADVEVQDENADVWKLEKFHFTGATILKKNAAAYTQTSLAAQAAATDMKGEPMPKEKDKKKVAAAHKDTGQGNNLALMTQAISASLGQAVQNAMSPLLTEIKASNERFVEGLEEIKGLHLIHAAADGGSDEDDDEIVLHAGSEEDASDEEQEEMEAAHEDASASASEMEARGEDEDEEESSASDEEEPSMEAALEDMGEEDASEEPGEVNSKRGNKNKGSKTTVTDPPTQGEKAGGVAKGRLHSAAAKEKTVKKASLKGASSTIQAAALIGNLQASVQQLKRQMKAQAVEHEQAVGKLRKRLTRMQAQAEQFARLEGRRSLMSHELVNIGEKVGVDFNETRMNGQKYSVRAFDTILAAAEQSGVVLNPQQRIHMKMLAEQAGILDEGAVSHGRA